MPNIKSAKKRLKTSQEAYDRNKQVRTRLKNTRRAFVEADAENMDSAYRAYCSVLDNAAKKGIVKKNTAIRRKTRAAARVRLSASTAA